MDALLKFIDSSGPVLILLLLLASIALGVLSARQAVQMRQFRQKWQALLTGVDAENLERLLYDHLRQSVAIETDMDEAKRRLDNLETRMKSSKRYAGLVRYDAFEDVGGSQSFALAIYDEDGNGIVVTSQVGRDSCRVYGKQITGGRSEVHLTTEEQKAIEIAASSRPRARISP